MIRRLFPALTLALAMLWPAAPAAAGDLETWDWIEMRVPLSEGQDGLPHSLRVFTDARLGTGYQGGLGQMFLRVGPIWELHPNLFLGVHTTLYVNQFDRQGQPGAFETVYRPEFEPNVRWRWGDFNFNDRNRLEYAWSERTSFWRYRNQLRVSYQPAGAAVFPYVWDELMIPLNIGPNQNRASAGMAFQVSPSTRIDVGYLFRSALSGGAWDHDHVFNVYLFFAPQTAPIFPATPAPAPVSGTDPTS